MLLKVAFPLVNAGIAQLVEQLICNQQVVGSNPSAGSLDGEVTLTWSRPLKSQSNALANTHA